MDTSQAIDLGRYAVVLVLTVGMLVLATSLLIGLVVSTLGAITQIQDYTLSFVPKIIGVALVAAATGPWMAAKVVEFAQEMFGSLP